MGTGMSAGSKTVRLAEMRPAGCTCRQPWQVCPVCAGTPRAQMVEVKPARETPSAQVLLNVARAYLVEANVQEIEMRLAGQPVVRGADVEQALGMVGAKREGL